jgi:hypothetical protein
VTLPLTKKELIRTAWVTQLRCQGHRQCRDKFFGRGGKLCAIGLLVEVADPHHHHVEHFDIEEFAQRAGLADFQVCEIIGMNDEDGASFAEIADQIELWFPVRRQAWTRRKTIGK